MENAKKLSVEVAYALPEKQTVLKLEVDEGATVEEVIRSSGILQRFPELDLSINGVGIYGKGVKLADAVRAGDRVEIYRPLIADPKAARKKRADGAPKARAAGSIKPIAKSDEADEEVQPAD